MKIRKIRALSIKGQKGFALLAALVLIVILALLGFRIANQGNDNAAVTGSNVRYNQVFEAAETSMRRAMMFIKGVQPGSPKATPDPSVYYRGVTEAFFKNLNISRLVADDYSPTPVTQYMSKLREYSFVWEEGALNNVLCAAPYSEEDCPAGIDFYRLMDSQAWGDLAIESVFTGSDAASEIDTDNYLANIRTYTFIEEAGTGTSTSKGLDFKVQAGDSSSGEITYRYYRITVKASGFPPIPQAGGGTTMSNNPADARENVILQTVFAKMVQD